MALGTWKEDPLENRELQETVNANVTTNVSAADLADIKKEEQLDAVLINQGVITQQTVDGLNADRVDLSDDVTGGNKSIISKKNQKLLDKKSKKVNPKGNKITKPAPPGILRYPYEGMTQHTDYLQIDIIEYKPVGREKTEDKTIEVPFKKIEGVDHDKVEKVIVKGQGAKFKGKMGGRRNSLNNKVGRTRSYALSRRPLKNEGTILLPIPSNVQDGNSVKVGHNNLNGLQAAGASAIKDAMSIELDGGMSQISDQFSKGLSDFKNATIAGTNLDTVKDVALNKLTASALGIFGGNVTVNQLMARQTGEIINPNMELLFDGPTIRAFKFQFKMTPRNRNEAEQIRLIIRAFKRNMAPKAKGGTEKENAWFLKTPNVFELRYRTGNKDHKYLHKFKQCLLTDIAVNYTGDGVYSTYEDGSPVSYLMDLSFKELEPIYDIDYDAVNDHDSVGY